MRDYSHYKKVTVTEYYRNLLQKWCKKNDCSQMGTLNHLIEKLEDPSFLSKEEITLIQDVTPTTKQRSRTTWDKVEKILTTHLQTPHSLEELQALMPQYSQRQIKSSIAFNFKDKLAKSPGNRMVIKKKYRTPND